MIQRLYIITLTTTLLLIIAAISCGHPNKKTISLKTTNREKKPLDLDTSKIAIFSFDEISRNHFDSSCVAAELTQDELDDVDSLLIACVTNYNNSLPVEHKGKGIDLKNNNYKEQLVVVRNGKGHKEVWINCLCNTKDGNLWKLQIVEVEDGGRCFFNFKINLTTKEFYDLTVNGSA